MQDGVQFWIISFRFFQPDFFRRKMCVFPFLTLKRSLLGFRSTFKPSHLVQRFTRGF